MEDRRKNKSEEECGSVMLWYHEMKKQIAIEEDLDLFILGMIYPMQHKHKTKAKSSEKNKSI